MARTGTRLLHLHALALTATLALATSWAGSAAAEGWDRPEGPARTRRYRLKPQPRAVVPAIGARTDIHDVATAVLGPKAAARFDEHFLRWDGPSLHGRGEQPYSAKQTLFEERPFAPRLTNADLETLLGGVALVMRDPKTGQVDYFLRDHHMLDLFLYHYHTTGELPERLLHLDRHSDFAWRPWAGDYQAATWWGGLWNLLRPDGRVLLKQGSVVYGTAVAPASDYRKRPIGSANRGAAYTLPLGALRGDANSRARQERWASWRSALRKIAHHLPDVVSLDMDLILPEPQLRLTKKLLRDPRFQRSLTHAKVRVFVVSPQFLEGGDNGTDIRPERMRDCVSLLNVLRAGLGAAPR